MRRATKNGRYRNSIGRRDLLRVMRGTRWHSLTELTGALSPLIPPEIAIRLWARGNDWMKYKNYVHRCPPLEIQAAKGKRLSVTRVGLAATRLGFLEHKRIGKETYYRLAPKETEHERTKPQTRRHPA
jgi:hypothetical protein